MGGEIALPQTAALFARRVQGGAAMLHLHRGAFLHLVGGQVLCRHAAGPGLHVAHQIVAIKAVGAGLGQTAQAAGKAGDLQAVGQGLAAKAAQAWSKPATQPGTVPARAPWVLAKSATAGKPIEVAGR